MKMLRALHSASNHLGTLINKMNPPAAERFTGTGGRFPRIILAAVRWDYSSRFSAPGHEYKRFIPALLSFTRELYFVPLENSKNIAPSISRIGTKGERTPIISVFQKQVPAGYQEFSRKGFLLINWYTDDDMLFENYSSKIARCFDLNVTTFDGAVDGYKAANANTFLSQWAGPEGFSFMENRRYLACFIGRMYGQRYQLMRQLRKEFGDSVFLHDTRVYPLNESAMVNAYQNSWIAIDEPQASDGRHLQIKARIFDNAAFGCVVATRYNPRLLQYYTPDSEILFWENVPHLIQMIKNCRNHPFQFREKAMAAYRRTLANHLYTHRFAEIFDYCQTHSQRTE